MKTLAMVVLIFSTFIAISKSAAQTVITVGHATCQQWTNQLTEPRKAWLLGFLSGFNAATAVAQPARGFDPLERLGSAEKAYESMNIYCEVNPDKSILDGALGLYLQLERDPYFSKRRAR